MKITKGMLDVYGYTDGCQGCRKLRLGQPPAAHSEQCRARMEAALRAPPDGAARVEHAEHRHFQAALRELEQQEQSEAKRRKVESTTGGGVVQDEPVARSHMTRSCEWEQTFCMPLYTPVGGEPVIDMRTTSPCV